MLGPEPDFYISMSSMCIYTRNENIQNMVSSTLYAKSIDCYSYSLLPYTKNTIQICYASYATVGISQHTFPDPASLSQDAYSIPVVIHM